MVGALASLQRATGWDAREADLVLGTSAGSVLAALLRCGVSVDELYDAHCGEQVTAELAVLPDRPPSPRVDLTGEPCWPGLPQLGLGSLPLMVRAARNPLRFPPSAVCAALVPRGRRQLTAIGKLIEGANASERWPTNTWVVAMNYHTGARVAFGRPTSPDAPLAQAVMASCAVPGWYAPVRIGHTPYVDGGVCSACNADLLAKVDLDEVFVLAPMASLRPDQPHGPVTWLERTWRRAVTKRLQREVERLRAAGADVTVLAPNADDLAVMGANMMDAARQIAVMRTARDSVAAQLAAPAQQVAPLDGAAA
jgi:NTE family protein